MGYVQYINGTTAENIPVTAHWIDASNESRITETKTLTFEQALSMMTAHLLEHSYLILVR